MSNNIDFANLESAIERIHRVHGWEDKNPLIYGALGGVIVTTGITVGRKFGDARAEVFVKELSQDVKNAYGKLPQTTVLSDDMKNLYTAVLNDKTFQNLKDKSKLYRNFSLSSAEEANQMREALKKLGIPEGAIACSGEKVKVLDLQLVQTNNACASTTFQGKTIGAIDNLCAHALVEPSSRILSFSSIDDLNEVKQSLVKSGIPESVLSTTSVSSNGVATHELKVLDLDSFRDKLQQVNEAGLSDEFKSIRNNPTRFSGLEDTIKKATKGFKTTQVRGVTSYTKSWTRAPQKAIGAARASVKPKGGKWGVILYGLCALSSVGTAGIGIAKAIGCDNLAEVSEFLDASGVGSKNEAIEKLRSNPSVKDGLQYYLEQKDPDERTCGILYNVLTGEVGKDTQASQKLMLELQKIGQQARKQGWKPLNERSEGQPPASVSQPQKEDDGEKTQTSSHSSKENKVNIEGMDIFTLLQENSKGKVSEDSAVESLISSKDRGMV